MEFEHPYSANAFNGLPDLAESRGNFVAQNGSEVIKALGGLFVQHNLAGDFGVALLHRHFALEDNQRLVDVNGTSTPWNVPHVVDKPAPTTVEKHGGKIRPHMWMLSPAADSRKHHLTPYEFFFDSANDKGFDAKSHKLDPSFVQQFAAVLATHNLIGTLGLCLLQDDAADNVLRAEVTEGRANVTFPHDPARQAGETEMIEAQWQYIHDEEGPDGVPIVRLACNRICVESIFSPSGHAATHG